jgi:hypothetical protein
MAINLERMCYIDFETDNSDGKGLMYYHKDFRVTSASFVVGDRVMFTTDPQEIKDTLAYFMENAYTIVAYNIAFDCAIIKHVYGYHDVFEKSLDAWRLFNYVNLTAGDKRQGTKRKTSLPAAVEYLFNIQDYKRPYLDKIIEMGLAKTDKEAHANIGRLPEDLLEEYNNLDTTYCKAVLEECLKRLVDWGTDWSFDYGGFVKEVELYSDSYFRGIKIDTELMRSNIAELEKKLAEVSANIQNTPEVRQVEAKLNNKPLTITRATITAWKKTKGLDKSYCLGEPEMQEVMEWYKAKKWVPFNLNSTSHKRILFLDVLDMKVMKLTKGGAKTLPKAAMSKAVLKCYGDMGKLFLTYQNLIKQHEECVKILELSLYDGRLHPTLRSGQTLSGRSSSKATN